MSNFDDEKIWKTFFFGDNLKLWTRSSKIKIVARKEVEFMRAINYQVEYVIHIDYCAAIEELSMMRRALCSNRRYQTKKESLKNLIDAIKEISNKHTNNFGEKMRNESIAIWLKKCVDES